MKAIMFFTLLFSFLGYQVYAIATEWHPDAVAPMEMQEHTPCLTQDEHVKKYPHIKSYDLVSAMFERCAR